MSVDHYAVLGVPREASAEEIRDAFRRAAAEAHPDRDGGSHDAMAAVNEAHRVLGDVNLRKRYDATGEGGSMDIEQEAVAFISMLLEKALGNCTGPEFSGLLVFMVAAAKAARDAAGRGRADAAELARRLKRAAKRMKRKTPGPNTIADILLHKAANADKAKAANEHGLKVTSRVLELLDEYDELQDFPDDPLLSMRIHSLAGAVKLSNIG
jgi:curved DNA-binding protein CbpA